MKLLMKFTATGNVFNHQNHFTCILCLVSVKFPARLLNLSEEAKITYAVIYIR